MKSSNSLCNDVEMIKNIDYFGDWGLGIGDLKPNSLVVNLLNIILWLLYLFNHHK